MNVNSGNEQLLGQTSGSPPGHFLKCIAGLRMKKQGRLSVTQYGLKETIF